MSGRAPLVIGLGNPLAGDDGAGAAIAAGLRDRPGLRVVEAHQLVPELAAEVAEASLVVFADAAVGGDGVRVEDVLPATAAPVLGHALRPADLVALARSLFGRCPPTYLVTVPGADFAPSDQLSEPAARAIPEAIALVDRLIASDPAPGRAAGRRAAELGRGERRCSRH